MFITFYDKDFRAISDNSSVTIGSYKLSRRSYDLDTFNCKCQPIDLDADPMFAIIKKDEGAQYYACLSPIFSLDKDGKGSVVARDLKSIFNTQVLIDFTKKTFTTVKEMIEFIFNQWKMTPSGFTVTMTVENIPGVVHQPYEKKAYNILDLFKQIFAFYEVYIESTINEKTKTLNFAVKKINTAAPLNLKLEDYGIQNFGKSIPAFNRAIAMDKDYTSQKVWYLLANGSITDTASQQDIFPTLTRVYISEVLQNAEVDAIMELAENRNQESIKIELSPIDNYYDKIDFSVAFKVYYKGQYYKTLPIGSIDTSEGVKKTVTLGYKPVELIQII